KHKIINMKVHKNSNIMNCVLSLFDLGLYNIEKLKTNHLRVILYNNFQIGQMFHLEEKTFNALFRSVNDVNCSPLISLYKKRKKKIQTFMLTSKITFMQQQPLSD
ncbi:hypothetical protein L9F63_026873, partial [Diploptera punctata]